MTTVSTTMTTHPDGRVDLPDHSAIRDSRFYNAELAPVPVGFRTWNTYNYTALWMAMAFCVPSYSLAAGLILLGMNWLQAFLTITLANVIVLVPMLLNSHAGTKYGIPYPVYSRAFYGIRGANLAALLRALVACGWFGVQTWIGGSAMYSIIGRLTGPVWVDAGMIAGKPWTLWLCFALFWAAQMVLIWRGMNAVKMLENWAAPVLALSLVAVAVWIVGEAGGIGTIFSQESQLGWGADFWKVFAPSLMGMIAFWATLSLNIPDFSRFAASQRKQTIGQALGLPTSMAFIAILSIIITSSARELYADEMGDDLSALFNPVNLVNQFDSSFAVFLGLIVVIVATVSTNLAANVVSPSYDFSNAFPKRISFRAGGLITGIIGVVILPWKLFEDPDIYIFAWLNTYGGLLAPVAGVLAAGYWIRARTHLDLRELYEERGRYWYTGGWHWPALAATLIGALLAVGGAYSNVDAQGVKTGPFPVDGLIPFLKGLYDYSWMVGFVAAFVAYLVLTAGRRDEAASHERRAEGVV
ncbi:NCS1 family nucleobase:cation symporter-1 [Actinophytocola gossypii]|uniref:NCS1 family nucleobase:cation symporter-1 n=1 Tax=Actinophytocola gossypii TaxID=2812003 RepID=A0ABT2J9H3_9PSEU|nr:NCS1 family nucleobase:cation symporter-1 [Actinophytocola gossypii]MCT2583914.1 NCS1 family nucleobase:cation symporter-1 [Actinophytocola gossypii]